MTQAQIQTNGSLRMCVGDTVQLTGVGQVGTVLTHEWIDVSGAGNVSFSNPTGVTTNMTILSVGDFEIEYCYTTRPGG